MKWGILAAVFAFAISFLLGLFSGSPVFIIFLRAVIFAVVFFLIGFGLFFFFFNILGLGDTTHSANFVDISVGDDTVRGYGEEFSAQPGDAGLPRRAAPPEFSTGEAGKLDDISQLFSGNAGSGGTESAGVEFASPAVSPDEAFDSAPGGASSGGLEQNTDSSYNKFGSVVTPASEDSPSPQKRGAAGAAGAFTDFSNFVPGMPGLEGVYSADSGNKTSGSDSSGGQNRLMAGTVEMSIEKPKKEIDFGNHDGKKMAGAIQTMLKRDDE
jgi:hypothetical protein